MRTATGDSYDSSGSGIVYDALMRLPIVFFELYFLTREFTGVRRMVAAHPYFGHDWFWFVELAARVSIVLFILVLISLHLTRRRPVKKYASVVPKIGALAGTLLTYAILLTPRAQPSAFWAGASLALTVVGSTFAILAVSDLGRSLSVMPEARKLVTGGLYARIRHPLYLAEEIATIGFFLQFRSWMGAAILLVHFYVQVKRMDWEEGILTEAFGDYREYKGRTFRLVPGVY